MHGFWGDCRGGEARWRGRSGFDFFSEFWGGPRGRGGHWRGRAGRVFEQGDLKYVVLQLLDEKPRHGYDVIKAIEERFGGAYAPSPGTVYPTLQMLEDLGYARATPEEGGKKIYEITPEGREHLASHRTTVDDIFERMARFVEGLFDAPATEVHQAFKEVGRATFSVGARHVRDTERMARIREVLLRAAREIDEIGK